MKYIITGQRYGGEHTIGIISKETAKYWETQDNFEEYIFDADDRNNDGSIPEKYQLPNWYEIDDVFHTDALEYADMQWIDVLDCETNELVAEAINITTISIINTNDAEQEHRDANPEFDGAYVFGQSFEKGAWEYELETDKPFDISKLKANVSEWSGVLLVEALVYDGTEMVGMCEDSVGKSMNCFIER